MLAANRLGDRAVEGLMVFLELVVQSDALLEE